MGNLQFHLLKHHKIVSAASTKQIVQYFCPAPKCKYNINENMANVCLPTLKSLRQHYQKVHAIKSHKCKSCPKMFSTETLCNRHERDCGKEFKCVVCEWKYNSKEALLTHSKRKGHIQPNYDLVEDKKSNARVLNNKKPTENFKVQISKRKSQTTQTIDKIGLQNPNKRFLDKWNKRVQAVPQANLKTVINFEMFDTESNNLCTSSSSQTDQNLNYINYLEDDSLTCFGKNSFQTVSCNNIETQTEFDPFITGTGLFFEHSNEMSSNTVDNMVSSNMYTQTCDDILSALDLADIETQTKWTSADNELFVSTETQTSFNADFVKNSSTCTQTELDSFIACSDMLFDHSLPSIRTTDQMVCSNMHTQTCGDILSNFGLADTETQTNRSSKDCNELLVSTETQTNSTANFVQNSSTFTQTTFFGEHF